jgi:signal peptidase
MSPTLEPGDGFVAVPAQLAGPVGEGDVVTFRAEEIQGGGLTTHRIVEETDRGFVTRGDANPFTDQDGDEPPVRREQVVAVAWAPGGSVFVVPALGTAVSGVQGALDAIQRTLAQALGTRALLGTQGLAYLLFAGTVLFYLLDVYRSSGSKERERDRERSQGTSARLLVAGMALLIVAGATAAMLVPAGTQTFGVVSAEFESEGARVIQQGTSDSLPYPVGNSGVVPVVAYLEPGSDAVTVDPDRLSVGAGEVRNATVTLSAPPETGYYRRFLTEHRYLAVLPGSTIDTLYRLHPWAPILAIDALLGIPFYLLGTRLVGTGRLRSRSSERPSRLARLRNRYL